MLFGTKLLIDSSSRWPPTHAPAIAPRDWLSLAGVEEDKGIAENGVARSDAGLMESQCMDGPNKFGVSWEELERRGDNH